MRPKFVDDQPGLKQNSEDKKGERHHCACHHIQGAILDVKTVKHRPQVDEGSRHFSQHADTGGDCQEAASVDAA